MAEYGLEIRDSTGRVVLDNRHLTQRLWYSNVHRENTIYTYPEPLDHEPTIVSIGINGYGAPIEHRMSGGKYIGFRVTTNQARSVDDSLVVIFLRE